MTTAAAGIGVQRLRNRLRLSPPGGTARSGPPRAIGAPPLFAAIALALLLVDAIPSEGGLSSAVPGSGANRLSPATTGASEWPTYLQNVRRWSANPNETTLAASNAGRLAQLWRFATGATVDSNPAVVSGIVYVGSWDGYEYALAASNGGRLWRTFLGTTGPAQLSTCTWTLGVTSSATVQNGFVYVGGGDGYFYALYASNGTVAWRYLVGSPGQGYYNWGSPLLYRGYAYLAASSDCDKPLVRGALLQVSLSTHRLVHAFYVVPAGQVGGSIWSSPAVDTVTNTLYVTTGNPATTTGTPNYCESIVALNATNVSRVVGSWRVPSSQIVSDGDFGATPTLFYTAAGTHHYLVAAGNKNGWSYVWDRRALGTGPVWEQKTSYESLIAPDALDFSVNLLYVAGGKTSINGANASGSVRALNVSHWPFSWQWQKAIGGQPLGAPAYANGILAVGAAHDLYVLNALTGATLRTIGYGTSKVNAAPAIAEGRIFQGASNASVYAYYVPGTVLAVSSGPGTSAPQSSAPPRADERAVGAVVALPGPTAPRGRPGLVG